MVSVNTSLSINDLDTMIEALAIAASRRESQARTVKHGRHHDIAANKMRALRQRLWRIRYSGPHET